LGTVVIPYVKRVSENFRRIWNWYNIRTVLKTNHTLRRSIVKTRPDQTWILWRPYTVYTVYPVNVVGVTLGRPADH
jgi:hypothetical protein